MLFWLPGVAVTIGGGGANGALSTFAGVGGGVSAIAPIALTTMLNSSLTNPPLLSLAVTFTETVLTSEAAGMPEKVRVVGAKSSHVGSAAPSGFVAV